MIRRSQGEPSEPYIPEIERILREIRQSRRVVDHADLYEEEYSSASEMDAEANARGPNNNRQNNKGRLFRDFGYPEEYELSHGIRLPTTESDFTIHPQYTRMVQEEQFSRLPHEDPLAHLN